MASSEAASHPKYSIRGTSRRGLGADRAVRLDFCDDGILVYRRHFNFRRDNDYSLLRRVEYSEVRHCEYLTPHVESGSTFTGFVWGVMPAEIELSISASRKSEARQRGDALWRSELLRFSGAAMTENEFKEMYAWLRTKVGPERENA